MASDPELPRFAGPSCHWQKAGQSRIDLPRKAARSSAASQHLLEEVLHFVCELRGTHNHRRRLFSRAGYSFLSNDIGRGVWVLARASLGRDDDGAYFAALACLPPT